VGKAFAIAARHQTLQRELTEQAERLSQQPALAAYHLYRRLDRGYADIAVLVLYQRLVTGSQVTDMKPTR
jgi:hypothetical protein